jgi:predicted RNase H-like nuclease (RuvC/YqgF family)
MAKPKTELQELSEFIRDHMVTKADLGDLKVALDAKIEKLATKNDISALSRELESIKEQLTNVSGFGKEIDHALERIAAIEKHLGIGNKMLPERAELPRTKVEPIIVKLLGG